MESLDKDKGWRESDFDFIQLNLRTILLKRELSIPQVIYTDPSIANGVM